MYIAHFREILKNSTRYLTVQARGNEEWSAENVPLYNIPGLRKAPPRQANSIVRHGYQEN